MFDRTRAAIAVLGGLLGCLGIIAEATAASAPIDDFFRHPQMLKPVLSPDGRRIAVAIQSGGHLALAVIELDKLDQSKVVAGFNDADVTHYEWVNDERLVYSVSGIDGVLLGGEPGLWAVNRDGGHPQALIEAHWPGLSDHKIGHDILSPEWHLKSVLRDGSADVLVQALRGSQDGTLTTSNLDRLDTLTGRTTSLSAGAPPRTLDWVADGHGRVAYVVAQPEARVAVYRKDGDAFQKLSETDLYSTRPVPWRVTDDGTLFVVGSTDSDYKALYRADSVSGRAEDKATVSTPGYDFSGDLVYSDQDKRLLGVHFETDGPGTAWLDPDMRALQAKIDKLLPGTSNRIDCERCIEVPTVVVTAASDRQPPRYYLFDRRNERLQPIGAARPWVDATRMAALAVTRFTARDGLSIPVQVTRPVGANGAGPTVMLVHGGPFVRGNHWRWESQRQFLASRGYTVVELDFRGSTGYGFSLFRAGWKHWGTTMQDDVADAAKWAVAQGFTDPKRICIGGASYGGYAVLMGMIRYPELYRCGFEWAGVTDINLIYSISWSDAGSDWKRYGLPTIAGDPVADAQLLKDASPLEHAAQLTGPLLMAYGAEDLRVPLKHGTAFHDAVTRTNHDVEWVVYPGEGHGWRKIETDRDFWGRVERFLDRNLAQKAN